MMINKVFIIQKYLKSFNLILKSLSMIFYEKQNSYYRTKNQSKHMNPTFTKTFTKTII